MTWHKWYLLINDGVHGWWALITVAVRIASDFSDDATTMGILASAFLKRDDRLEQCSIDTLLRPQHTKMLFRGLAQWSSSATMLHIEGFNGCDCSRDVRVPSRCIAAPQHQRIWWPYDRWPTDHSVFCMFFLFGWKKTCPEGTLWQIKEGIIQWKITMFNGKIHYFYGHFQ